MASAKRISRRRVTVLALIVVFVVFVVAIIVPVVLLSRIGAAEKTRLEAMLEYFGVEEGKDITWAHAVNNRMLLNTSLEDAGLMMLEADVLLDSRYGIPIMAHPPSTSSDLTLAMFVRRVLGVKRKGFKLDFKDIKAIPKSLDILRQEITNETHKGVPFMLNADVLIGPNNPIQTPLPADTFFEFCEPFEGSILSPGWTTAWNNASNNTGYSWDMVQSMEKLTRNLTHSVTFPVRASLTTISREQLTWLIEKDLNRYSLTVWSPSTDAFNCKEMDYLLEYPKHVMYDLPPKLCS